MSFAKRLEIAMRRAGIDQTELEKRSGVDNTAISRLLSEQRKNPRLATVERLAKALNVTHEWLASGEGSPPAPIVFEDADGFGEVFPVRTPIEEVLEHFAWPDDLEPEHAAEVVRRVREEHFKTTESIPQSYWHSRVQRLIREVQGRAKSVPQRGASDDVDLTQESPEIRKARKPSRGR